MEVKNSTVSLIWAQREKLLRALCLCLLIVEWNTNLRFLWGAVDLITEWNKVLYRASWTHEVLFWIVVIPPYLLVFLELQWGLTMCAATAAAFHSFWLIQLWTDKCKELYFNYCYFSQTDLMQLVWRSMNLAGRWK